MALLEVKNLSISFGGLKAVDGFHIDIEKGQLYGLIGPNGAGKTTTMKMLLGLTAPTSGTVSLFGQPHRIPDSLFLGDGNPLVVHHHHFPVIILRQCCRRGTAAA